MIDYAITSQAPLWWLDTAFGNLVFILFFITWGLAVIALVLSILYLVKKLFGKDK